jgi:hydrogenase expression/formation protein HypE
MADEVIQLAHGGGGRLSRDFLRDEILPRFGGPALRDLADAATIDPASGPLAFTTDSFVVQPLEFPGGDIGALAVHGTVNDLAVSGARPRWLSLGLVIEEGLPLARLRAVLDSVRDAAAACGVRIVTGDTKVVRRGQCDGLYINTAGIGERWPGLDPAPGRIRPGDAVLLSGPIGDHGMAVMAARERIPVRPAPRSDCGPVHGLVESLLPWAGGVRFLRDPTRGGLAAVLNEVVDGAPYSVELDEAALPYSTSTRAAAEILGIDLLHVACEGRVVGIVAPDGADGILAAWRARPDGRAAAVIGRVTDATPGRLVLETAVGGRRLVDFPRGELLPRIC